MGKFLHVSFFGEIIVMKNKVMYFALALVSVFMILSGCTEIRDENSAIARVNGENIFFADLDLARRQYDGRDVSDSSLLSGLIKERVVLQYFEKTGEKISNEEIDLQYQLLQTTEYGNVFYEKAVDEYGTDEKVREAIKYRLMYNSVRESIKSDFLNEFLVDKEGLTLRTEDFIAQFDLQNLTNDEKEEYKQAVAMQYNDALINEIFDLYFQVWLNRQVDGSNIEYLDNVENPFAKEDIQLKDEKLFIGQNEIPLKEVTFTEAQEVYGNFLYIPNRMKTNDGLTILGYHDSKRQVKCLVVRYINEVESVSINISLEVSPDLYNLEDGIETSEADDVNTLELNVSDIGVKYTISSSMDIKLLEQDLRKMIPYAL